MHLGRDSFPTSSKFNHDRIYEFRFNAPSVNIEIEAAGGKRGNVLCGTKSLGMSLRQTGKHRSNEERKLVNRACERKMRCKGK